MSRIRSMGRASLKFKNNRQVKQLQLVSDISEYLQRWKSEMISQGLVPTWENFTKTDNFKIIQAAGPHALSASKQLWENIWVVR